MAHDSRRVWVGNLPEKVDENLLYELFIQAGPIESVSVPKQLNGRSKLYGFVTFKQESSPTYARALLSTTRLYGQYLNIKPNVRDELVHDRREESVEEVPSVPSLNALRGIGSLNSKSGKDAFAHNWKTPDAPPNLFDVNQIKWPEQTNIGMPDFNTLLQLNPMMGGQLYPSQQYDSIMPQDRGNYRGQDRGYNQHQQQRHNDRPHPYRNDRHYDRHGPSSDRYQQGGSRNQQYSSSSGRHHRERKGRRH